MTTADDPAGRGRPFATRSAAIPNSNLARPEDLRKNTDRAQILDRRFNRGAQPIRPLPDRGLGRRNQYGKVVRVTDTVFRPQDSVDQAQVALRLEQPPPKRLAMPITSRIKVMSGLNIAERRLPQDGRIQLSIGGRLIDLRVSTLPTQFGESVVLRVLDRSVVSLELENLGMPDDVYTALAGYRQAERHHHRDRADRVGQDHHALFRAAPAEHGREEAPHRGGAGGIRYRWIIQVPVNEAAGNTFARILRAFLRQDPDVMMIGEIRDLETAQIAIQASLTGHLVFSTLHTNDAAGAIARLIDMGVEPYLISSTLEAVLGQRLVRKICDHCGPGYVPDDAVLRRSASRGTTSVTGSSLWVGVPALQRHGVPRPERDLRAPPYLGADP